MKQNIEFGLDVIAEIENGRKLSAIKLLRESHNLGLKEAKELVDAYCAENNISTDSSIKVSSNGLMIIIALGLIAYIVYSQFK